VSEPAAPGIRGDEEAPPVGGSWKVLYIGVAANLAILILLFYVFTKAFE
jgi:hypothetical protein